MQMRSWCGRAAVLGVVLLVGGRAHASTASEILALTGGSRAKFVWSAAALNWSQVYLRTFDTDTGTIQQIRTKAGGGAYGRPLITADGQKILYLNTDGATPATHVVNFDGTGDSTLLTDVWTSDVWRDPNTQKDYIIGVVGTIEGDLYKIEMDNTANRTLIWDKIPAFRPTDHDEKLEWGWLTMSPDGEYICSAFPFMGGCGVGVVKTVDLAQPNYFRGAGTGHEGCWTCIVPDGTHRFMTLNYAHDAWWFNTAPAGTEVTVSFTSVPDPEGQNANHNVYYNQFTNDPQFVVCTENYDDDPADNSHGKHAYMAKMSANLESVTDWVILCDEAHRAYNIDGWIDPGSSPPVDPTLSFSPVSLSFTAEIGMGDPAAQPLTVTNAGGGTLDVVTISGEPTWLTVNRTGTGDTQSLENVVDVTGLIVGTYSDTITVTCANAVPSTKTYTVTLSITDPGRDPDIYPDTIPGLVVTYYVTTVASLPPVFGALTPIRRRLTTAAIDYASTTGEFATSGRSDGVSAQFDGFVEVPTFGEYTFYVESDDSAALYIGTTQVVDNDGPHAMSESSGSIWLKAGKHDFRVQYTEDTGSAGLIVRYEGPGITKKVIPASSLWTNDKVIDLVSPVGGEVWYVGATRYVQWDAPNVSPVQVHISTDDGGSWVYPTPSPSEFESIPLADPNWGYYPVVVPNPTSTQCRISVRAYINGVAQIVSENTFEIRAFIDGDADGMPDAWETDNLGGQGRDGTGDLDGDDVSDLDEFLRGSDPNSDDGDGDGMPDAWEVTYGTNPGADDTHLDPDGDGSTNLEEFQNGTNPLENENASSSTGLSCGAGAAAGPWGMLLLAVAAALYRARRVADD